MTSALTSATKPVLVDSSSSASTDGALNETAQRVTNAVRGNVMLTNGDWGISCGLANAALGKYCWGVPKAPHEGYICDVMGEPYVPTTVYSKESEEYCKNQHVDCTNFGRQGSWKDDHPVVKNFPWALPLRFFINNDGTYKEDGDTIKLIYDGQPIVLTCTFRSEKYDGEPIESFSAGIQRRIKHSQAAFMRCLNYSDVAKAKELAMANTEEWIDSGAKLDSPSTEISK